MKKFIYLALVLVAGFAAVSCSTDDEVKKQGLVFTGSIDAVGTRTNIDNTGKVSWVAGDEVSINGIAYTATPTGDGTTATFAKKNGGDPDPVAPFVATYGDLSNQVCTDVDGCNNYAPMRAESSNTTLQFRNTAAVLKISVKGAEAKTITRIDVSDATSGRSLTCDPGVTLSTSDLTDFYLALDARTYSGPVAFTFIADDNTYCTKTYKKSISLSVNQLFSVSLSNSPLEFQSAAPTVTYYNTSGKIADPGSGTSFNCSGKWVLSFSSTAGEDAVHWDRGDILEWEVTSATGGIYEFTVGDENDSSSDGVLTAYTNGGTWFRFHYINNGSSMGTIFNTQNGPRYPHTYRLSKDGGLEFKTADTDWATVTGATEYLPLIWKRGTSIPLYFGATKEYPAANYAYFKITRAGAPAPPVAPVSVTGVSLDKSELLLSEGGEETLVATITPATPTNPNITWTSSNTSVATVSNGVVTAVAEGNATITVTTEDGGYTATCAVTVTPPAAVTGVTLNKSAMTLDPGTQETLTATVLPSNAANKNVTWTSSNTSAATVSDGVVTAVAGGSATITVTTEDGGYTATCEVTVPNMVIKYLDNSNGTWVNSLPAGFYATGGFGPAQLPTINWANGDYIEIQVTDLNDGCPLIISDEEGVVRNNTPNSDGKKAIYLWPASSKSVRINNGETPANILQMNYSGERNTVFTFKISNGKVEYKTDSNPVYTDITSGHSIALQSCATLYIGAERKAQAGEYKYIKVVNHY